MSHYPTSGGNSQLEISQLQLLREIQKTLEKILTQLEYLNNRAAAEHHRNYG